MKAKLIKKNTPASQPQTKRQPKREPRPGGPAVDARTALDNLFRKSGEAKGGA